MSNIQLWKMTKIEHTPIFVTCLSHLLELVLLRYRLFPETVQYSYFWMNLHIGNKIFFGTLLEQINFEIITIEAQSYKANKVKVNIKILQQFLHLKKKHHASSQTSHASLVKMASLASVQSFSASYFSFSFPYFSFIYLEEISKQK